MTFKDLINEEAKYSIEQIQKAMIDSKEFAQDEVMSGISKALTDETGTHVTPKSKYTWKIINISLSNMNISPKKIVQVLSKIK